VNTRYVTLGVPSLLICGLASFLFMGKEKVATPARGSLQMTNASWNMTRGIWSVRSVGIRDGARCLMQRGWCTRLVHEVDAARLMVSTR
jgi:hypothetical protein